MTLELPVQPLRCSNVDCTLAQGGRCARIAEFAEPLSSCESLVRWGKNDDPPEQVLPSAIATVTADRSTVHNVDGIAWSGRHLESHQVGRMMHTTLVRVVAVLGLSDAGKTCLLTSCFLQLANGQRTGFPFRFASSKTLYGWKTLAERANQWLGQPGEQIVAHTPKQSGLLLHLGLRPEDVDDDRYIDVMLSDVPGEWVLDWAEHNRIESQQRIEFIRHAQAALVLLDSHELLSEDGSEVVADTALLLRRLVSFVTKEPKRKLRAVNLVLTKSDLVPLDTYIPEKQEDRTRSDCWDERLRPPLRAVLNALRQLRELGVKTEVFVVSAFPRPLSQGQPVGVLAPLASALRTVSHGVAYRQRTPVPERVAHSFLALRRWKNYP